MKILVEVGEDQYEVTIPDEVLSDENWMNSFRETFFDLSKSKKDAAIQLAKHLVHNYRNWPYKSFIEGLGNIKVNGEYMSDVSLNEDPSIMKGFNITIISGGNELEYEAKVIN